MHTNNKQQVTRSNQTDWKPLVEADTRTEGVSVKILRFDGESKRPPTFLLKFDAGSSYPNHRHPAGEEIYVLEGEVRDYLYAPPSSTHSAFSKTGCVMLFVVPEEVEIL